LHPKQVDKKISAGRPGDQSRTWKFTFAAFYDSDDNDDPCLDVKRIKRGGQVGGNLNAGIFGVSIHGK
jgi:hypothetical protein